MDISAILERLKPHWLPIILGMAGVIFLGYGLVSVLDKSFGSAQDKSDILFEAASDSRSTSFDSAQDKKNSPISEKRLTVDVEGAVEKPGVYDLSADSRVQDALIAAGGMNKEADRAQISKSLNLAAKITDGGKIYIPRVGDQILATGGEGVLGADTSSTSININTASSKELDSLPGIGEVTAQKVITSRPYSSVEELLQKKVVSQKVFDQIKEKISVY